MPSPPWRARLRSCSLFLVTTLSFSATVQAMAAPDWGRAFQPGAVASHLPAGKTSLIVVGAGPSTPELQGATAAIEQALRKSGRAGLVMNASGLGPVDGLDDAAIVKKCAALPVESIAIARVFPGSDDGQPQAVVTLYGKNGELKSAFSGTAGGSATPAPSVEAEGTGVSTAAVAGVADVVRGTERTSAAAQERYDREYLSIAHVGTDDLQATQGKYSREMSIPEFYRALGRDDLASAYQERKVFKIVLMVAGMGTAVGATLLSADGPTSGTVVAITGGVGAAMLGLLLPNAYGMEPAALRETVDKHNASLKKKLELSPGGGAATKVRGPSWMAAPFVSTTGGGLALGGSF